MALHAPVGYSAAELQLTRGELGHVVGSYVTEHCKEQQCRMFPIWRN